MTIRREMLEEAASLVDGERNADYGDPNQDFQRTATYWTTYLEGRKDPRGPIEKHDVAIMMILLKVSRLSWSPEKRDHYVDAAGYAACGLDCAEKRITNADDVNDSKTPAPPLNHIGPPVPNLENPLEHL